MGTILRIWSAIIGSFSPGLIPCSSTNSFGKATYRVPCELMARLNLEKVAMDLTAQLQRQLSSPKGRLTWFFNFLNMDIGSLPPLDLIALDYGLHAMRDELDLSRAGEPEEVFADSLGRRLEIKSLSVNNSNFSPADYGCCQMMQGDITGIGFLKANQELTKPVEP